jgi:hypothetical protein
MTPKITSNCFLWLPVTFLFLQLLRITNLQSVLGRLSAIGYSLHNLASFWARSVSHMELSFQLV